MRSLTAAITALLVILLCPVSFFAQSVQSGLPVPRLINFSGVFRPADGQPPASVEVVTLAIYAEETGGTPVWQETQRIDVDSSGRYTVLLGATDLAGLPLDVFASGEARWLGIVWARPGEVEGPRTRLTSVPYALRAADADTLGGKPASAYLLAPTGGDRSTSFGTASGPVIQVVNPGTTNMLAKYVNPSDVGDSALYEAGGFVGVNTTSPFDALHVQFTNTTGGLTGYAVQNLGSTATSYSGMLFYDQNGALGQFQGFNNSTHEYRINNVASSGSINFMIGSASRFLVNNNGRISLSTGGTISTGTTAARGQAAGWTPPGSEGNGIFIEGGLFEGGGFYADGNTAAIWSPGDADLLRVYDEDTLPSPSAVPRFVIDGVGNIRVGVGTNGCVMDADNTIIAGTCSSDERLKKDIRPFDGGMLERALKRRPVYYQWRTERAPNRFAPISGEAYGLIAQEVEKIYPEMVATDDDGYKAVDYGKLQYVLLGALKEEHTKVEALDAKVATLEKRLAKLEATSDSATRAQGWTLAPWLAFAGFGAVAFTFYRRRT